jgi:deoxycytidylate deaminase
MNIDTTLIKNLKTLALSAGHPKVWVASALVHRNKIVSYGTNQMKTHPYQYRYGKNDQCVYWHAETLAIYNADKKLNFDKFKKSVLYVVRVKYNGTEKDGFVSGLAKPCSGCMRCIQEYGIKSVIYTLDYEENIVENFGVMIL